MAAAVPFLAVHGAGMAPDARVEIDDKTEFFGARGGFGVAGHLDFHSAP
jgi:hypothetical protein